MAALPTGTQTPLLSRISPPLWYPCDNSCTFVIRLQPKNTWPTVAAREYKRKRLTTDRRLSTSIIGIQMPSFLSTEEPTRQLTRCDQKPLLATHDSMHGNAYNECDRSATERILQKISRGQRRARSASRPDANHHPPRKLTGPGKVRVSSLSPTTAV